MESDDGPNNLIHAVLQFEEPPGVETDQFSVRQIPEVRLAAFGVKKMSPWPHRISVGGWCSRRKACPPGYGGSPRGGRAIGEAIAGLVRSTASRWSIDQVFCDPGSNRAVIEWTVRRTGALARGAEWYEFDPGTGLITEIRAYVWQIVIDGQVGAYVPKDRSVWRR